MFKPKKQLAVGDGAKHELVEHYQDKKGVWRIKGSSLLKGSQAYPVQILCIHLV